MLTCTPCSSRAPQDRGPNGHVGSADATFDELRRNRHSALGGARICPGRRQRLWARVWRTSEQTGIARCEASAFGIHGPWPDERFGGLDGVQGVGSENGDRRLRCTRRAHLFHRERRGSLDSRPTAPRARTAGRALCPLTSLVAPCRSPPPLGLTRRGVRPQRFSGCAGASTPTRARNDKMRAFLVFASIVVKQARRQDAHQSCDLARLTHFGRGFCELEAQRSQGIALCGPSFLAECGCQAPAAESWCLDGSWRWP